jgi:non-ribosomal peptide synthetase component F
VELVPHRFDGAKFDLTFDVYPEEDGGLRILIDWPLDLFDPATVARIAAHYERVLAQAADAPDLPRSRLDLLADDERTLLLETWGRNESAYPRAAVVHRLFEAQAAATPHATAVEFGEERVTYAELNARANRLARRLRALGAGSEVRVGFAIARSVEMVLAMLAILKAGAAYVPLDPALPDERLAFMLEDAGVSVLVTAGGALPAPVAGFGGARVDLLMDADALAAEAAEDLDDAATGPDSLAYVIYTSGSTGRPKGVGVPHRGVVRLVRGACYAAMGAGETFLQMVPVSFDVTTFEMWAPLLNGGRLVVFPPRIPTPREIGEVVRRHGVTTLWLTSGLFHLVVDEEISALAGVRQLLG